MPLLYFHRDDISAFGAAIQLGLTQSVLLASLPMLMHVSHLPVSFWSWSLGGTLFLYAMTAPWWGRYIDAHGPTTSLRITAVGTMLGNLLLLIGLLISQPLWAAGLVLLSRVIYAGFAGGQYPACQASVIERTEPQKLQVALGQLLAINQGGRLLGPVLVGLLAGSMFPWPVALLVVLGLLLIGVGAKPRLIFSVRTDASCSGSDAQAQAPVPLRQIWPALISAFLLTFAVSHVQFGLSFSLGEQFALGPQEAARLLSELMIAAVLAALFTQLVLLRLLSGHPLWQWLTVALSLGVAIILLLRSDSQLYVYLAIVLFAIAQGLSSPAYTAWARSILKSASGRMSAALASTHTLGHGAGIIAAGLMQQQSQLPLFTLVAVSGFSQVVVLGYLVRRRDTITSLDCKE